MDDPTMRRPWGAALGPKREGGGAGEGRRISPRWRRSSNLNSTSEELLRRSNLSSTSPLSKSLLSLCRNLAPSYSKRILTQEEEELLSIKKGLISVEK